MPYSATLSCVSGRETETAEKPSPISGTNIYEVKKH